MSEPRILLTFIGRPTPEIRRYLRQVEKVMNDRGVARKILKVRDDLAIFGTAVVVID